MLRIEMDTYFIAIAKLSMIDTFVFYTHVRCKIALTYVKLNLTECFGCVKNLTVSHELTFLKKAQDKEHGITEVNKLRKIVNTCS